MRIEIEVPEHDPGTGFAFRWAARPSVSVDHDGHHVFLAGDADGLRALAQVLLAVAGDGVPAGTELLADGWIAMTGDVPHLVVRRTERLLSSVTSQTHHR